MTQDWKTGINNMIRASKEVDAGTRDKIYEILRILGEIVKDNAKDNLDSIRETIKDNIDNLIKR